MILKGQYSEADLLNASPICQHWCYHIWGQYYKPFLKYHRSVVSKIIDGTST